MRLRSRARPIRAVLHERALRLGGAALSGFLRRSPLALGKAATWNRLVRPYLLWRPMAFTATSRFGARFHIRFPDLIQAYLYFFGVWEPVITRYLLARLKPGDVFIDVGANIGYYALLASRAVGETGKVHAIEASGRIFDLLQANLRLNRAANVTAHHVAVTGEPMRVPIYVSPEANLSATTTVAAVAAGRGAGLVETVDGRPLDQIVDAADLRRARFLKIDVEGAEWDVVQPLAPLLRSLPDGAEILIEVNAEALRGAGGSVEEFLALFAAGGFEPFTFENRYDIDFYIRPPASAEPAPLTDLGFDQVDLLFRRRDSA